MKKNVFLIGDSIRLGYRETVKRELADMAEVISPDDNCRFTQYVLVNLSSWAQQCDPEQVAVVQFNCGHWDVAHFDGEEESLNSVEVYGENIRRIIKKIRQFFPCAKIVFATTTTMNPNGMMPGNPRTDEEIARYNRAAVEACGEDVLINDLFAVTKTYGEEMYADYCHLTDEGFEQLGKTVAEFIGPLIG